MKDWNDNEPMEACNKFNDFLLPYFTIAINFH